MLAFCIVVSAIDMHSCSTAAIRCWNTSHLLATSKVCEGGPPSSSYIAHRNNNNKKKEVRHGVLCQGEMEGVTIEFLRT